ncbi:MAG: NAD-dependent epimerase [Deltaproteobacteria bacterium]|nr:NAD-dependent epimerase [Deltaproteobacteria bacterium]
MAILVTGAAGFIGFHLAGALLDQGRDVVGVDNLNPYYDPKLKKDRLAILAKRPGFSFEKLDLADREATGRLFETRFSRVVHLAAQAGVRHSITDPHAYVEANVSGFLNVLEGCKKSRPAHLVFASSSSVYGANTKQPFSVRDNVDHPLSLYAATKKAGELMAHTYAHLHGLPVTALRFFTVYGPWGRPDMALFKFTRAMLAGEPIEVYNQGDMKRDFTYIDDVVKGVVRVMEVIPEPNPRWSGDSPDPATSGAPYRLYNIGNNNPARLMDFIHLLEKALGMKAEKRFLPMQPGDVKETCADVADLAAATGYAPATPLEEGVRRFVEWYRHYYGT